MLGVMMTITVIPFRIPTAKTGAPSITGSHAGRAGRTAVSGINVMNISTGTYVRIGFHWRIAHLNDNVYQ